MITYYRGGEMLRGIFVTQMEDKSEEAIIHNVHTCAHNIYIYSGSKYIICLPYERVI